jgi:hypothetical protein
MGFLCVRGLEHGTAGNFPGSGKSYGQHNGKNPLPARHSRPPHGICFRVQGRSRARHLQKSPRAGSSQRFNPCTPAADDGYRRPAMAGMASAVAVAAGSFRTTVAAPGTRLHFLATDLNPHDCRPPRTPPCRVAAAPRSNRPARELLTKRHRRFGLSTQDPRSDRRTGSRGGHLVPHRTGRSDCRDDLTVGRPTSGSADDSAYSERILM